MQSCLQICFHPNPCVIYLSLVLGTCGSYHKVFFGQLDLDFEMKGCFDCLNACLPLSLRVCKWRCRIIDWDGGGVGWYSEWLPYPNIWHMMPSAAHTSRTALLTKYKYKYKHTYRYKYSCKYVMPALSKHLTHDAFRGIHLTYCTPYQIQIQICTNTNK